MLALSSEVESALAANRAVVALESTIIAHGFPYPENLNLARELEAVVRDNGAVPATIAVIDGQLCVGLSQEKLQLIASPDTEVGKAAALDLGICVASKKTFATTVSATMYCAARAGIAVFATGGIGGVHRGDTGDVSSDIDALRRFSVAVVSSGAKAILDLPRTLEALESSGVPVIGIGTEYFPAFYGKSSGLPLHYCESDISAIAEMVSRHLELGLGGLLLTNPIDKELEGIDIAGLINSALASAERKDIRGKDLTPFLLAELARTSGGATVVANRRLALGNAKVASQIAVAMQEQKTAGCAS